MEVFFSDMTRCRLLFLILFEREVGERATVCSYEHFSDNTTFNVFNLST